MNRALISFASGMFACSAFGGVPTMGGGMSHLLVTVFEQQVYLSFESPSMSTVQLQNYDERYDGNASVLDHHGYNSQFGWLANGFISLPPSSGIYVRTVRSSTWLDVYSESGFDPILGTDGSDKVWQWDGTMTHNWYATQMHGDHFVDYEVFVGDLSGNPLAGYGSGEIRLTFGYGDVREGIQYPIGSVVGALPSSSTCGVLLVGGVCVSRRRR